VTLPCFIRDLKALADAARVAWVRVAGDEIIACSVLYQVLAMAIYGMLFCGAVSRS
jgi:hypothetical protein